MSTPQQHPLIGQVIAERYQVVELLAEGGMGAVYIAEHLTLHKQVALKVVHPEHAGNEELIARFAREAMATSRIDHPNVISAMDFGQLPDGTAFLAVQLVRGPSLTRVLKAERRLPWPRAAALGAQIADALNAAHGHGIVHRDLKPDNVLLQFRDDGTELVKVLDFGVAKFAPESKVPLQARTDVTQVGMVVGTPGYMAPEQTIGNPADERSDLYALGVILWEAIVGEPLWSAPDLQALVEKQMSETPRLLREAAGDASIPEELETLVASLLARRAEERPDSASWVRDALRDHAASEVERPRWRTGARPAGRPPRSEEVTLPLDALKPDATMPALIVEEVKPATTSITAKPSVPPPPPPSTARRSRLPSSRPAWYLTGLLAAILATVVGLVATGHLELRPRGDMAEVAERVAEKLKLSAGDPPAEPARAADEKPAADKPPADPPAGKVAKVRTGVPPELAPTYNKLVRGDPEKSTEAAATILAPQHKSKVPSYVQRLALLQRAKTCDGKRAQIEALADLGDQRALPALKRLASRPRTGCGKRKREDCFGCLRKPLELAIEKLQRSRAK